MNGLTFYFHGVLNSYKKFIICYKVYEFFTDIKNVNKNATFVNEKLHGYSLGDEERTGGYGKLKLTVRPGEYLLIGDDIKLVFAGGSSRNLRILVDAPKQTMS